MSRATEILYMLNEQHSFAVVSVKLPDVVADQIRSIKRQIPVEYIDTNEDKNLDPHVTIFYGLSDEDLPFLAEELGSYGKPLHYTIEGRIEVFPGKTDNYKVLVLPVKSNCFSELHQFIRDITGKEPPTFREYKPHATIAYVKSNSPNNYDIPFHEISDVVDNVEFSTANDHCYTIFLRK